MVTEYRRLDGKASSKKLHVASKQNLSSSSRKREPHEDLMSKEALCCDSKRCIEKNIGSPRTFYYCKSNIHVWYGITLSEKDEGYIMQHVCSGRQPKQKVEDSR